MAVTLDQLMAAISGQESGGDYNAVNSFSGASGKFQFMPETWRAVAPMAGLPPDAPMTPENQEKVARAYMGSLWQDALTRNSGDEAAAIKDVASIWYSGRPLGDYTPEEQARPQAGGHPSIGEYADSIFKRVTGMAPFTNAGPQSSIVGTPMAGTLAEQMDTILAELSAQRPDKSSPYYQKNPSAYAGDFQEWMASYTATAALAQEYRNQSLGLLTLPDGSVIPYGDATPEQREQIERANQTQYASILNKFGLDQYDLYRQYTGDVNSVNQQNFTNASTNIQNSMARDNLSLSKAQQELSAWINAQDTATEDANRIQTARLEASKWGTTGGKTAFSANDLGAGLSTLAQQGGINTSVPMLNYPGVQTWDPVGDRMNSLAGMGVSNAPPVAPALLTPTTMPSTPALSLPPPPPQLQVPGYTTAPTGQLVPADTLSPSERIAAQGRGLQ